METNKKYKYTYWTFITNIGDEYKDKLNIGEHIGGSYKKEGWILIDFNKRKEIFMCSGIYNCRTLNSLSNAEKSKIIIDGMNRNAEILKFKLGNPKYFKSKEVKQDA